MNSLTLDQAMAFTPQISTSGAGVLQRVQKFVILVGGNLVTRGTATTEMEALDPELAFAEQTNSGLTLKVATTSQAAAISELRRRSGLTWDQIARLFGVARRSVHFWISGKALNAPNEERLSKLLITVRYIDRGGGAATRAALISAQRDGIIPFDLLAEGRFEEAMALLGQGKVHDIAIPVQFPAKPRPAVMPPSPDRLVGALQDTVHRDLGRTRAAHTGKVKKSP